MELSLWVGVLGIGAAALLMVGIAMLAKVGQPADGL